MDGSATEYFYSGTQLVGQKNGQTILEFLYDANGSPYAVLYSTNGGSSYSTYYYLKNLQGDVVALADASGAVVVRYKYDVWGKVTAVTNNSGTAITSSTHIANVNPIRYRGYYYDREFELYYLQTRYYDPDTGRFINADAFASTGQGILGLNMFAYCLGNPIQNVDAKGTLSKNTLKRRSDKSSNEGISGKESLIQILEAMIAPKDEGNTFAISGTISSSMIGNGSAISFGIAADSSYNYALQETTSLTNSGGGAGSSAGVAFSWTNARSVQDLKGTSQSYGVTLVAELGMSIEYVTFEPASQPGRTCSGINVVILFGAEAGVGGANNVTYSTDSWNPIRELLELFS